jgi:hypothetical protein
VDAERSGRFFEDVVTWELTDRERVTLGVALDALLPAEGSFPWPSEIRVIDDFILRRVPVAGLGQVPYPGLDESDLRAILTALAEQPEMTAALARLERDDPVHFLAFWRLAVYGYYSRPEVISAVARDLAPDYHGAPQPLGYAHAIPAWDASNALQNPRQPHGIWQRTEDVRRVELNALATSSGEE